LLLGGLQIYATNRGWLEGAGAGSAIVTVLTILALLVLAFLSCVSLNKADETRRKAEEQLRRMVVELDRGNKALQHEVAERKRLEEEAKHLASHDPLTGLPNRLLFVERLQHTISQSIRHASSCGLFYVDIDNFKPVNDRYGHFAGDELLKSLAHRLLSAVREVDMVARLGGDEFAVIMDSPASEGEAQILAKRICDAVTIPHRLNVPEPIEVVVGISIGIAVFPGHATALDDLVRLADTAMYQAKVGGKSQGRSTNIEFAVTA
jgi:diguanylate cyclase (GGDEF)-like protein